MQSTSTFSYAATLALLLAACTATPTPTPAEIFKRDFDWCGVSQFYDETSDASPYWLHCLQIRNNLINTKSGSRNFLMQPYQEYDLASWGNCKFRAKSNSAHGSVVGYDDVSDLIWDSINQFKRDNRIGARGRMICVDAYQVGKESVNWWIQTLPSEPEHEGLLDVEVILTLRSVSLVKSRTPVSCIPFFYPR